MIPLCTYVKSFFNPSVETADYPKHTDGKLFLTTNEEGGQSTISELSEEPIYGNTIVCTSGFFGLNVAAKRGSTSKINQNKIEYLVFVDNSKRVEKFWKQLEFIIRESDSRGEVKNKTIELLKKCPQDFFPGEAVEELKSSVKNLEREISSGDSWLSNEEQFQKIKKIFDKNHFVFLPIDLCHKKSIENLSSGMLRNSMKADLLYLSNVREYAEKDGRIANFRNSMEALLHSINNNNFCIDTIPRSYGIDCEDVYPLTQRIVRNLSLDNIDEIASSSPSDSDNFEAEI